MKGETNYNAALQYELETQGELVVAGITNQVAMPIFVLVLGDRRFRISGETSLKMSSFQIDPPAPSMGFGLIHTADEVKVLFDWVVEARTSSAGDLQKGTVPLVLDLPVPAFKGIPNDLRLDPNVEPLADKPRAPMLVPAGLHNIASLAVLTSSDKNAGADSLAKITDGDKNASDQSIILLRKGTQWVQMDWGSPQQIFSVVIWHAHNAAKVYHDVIVRVADDADFVHARTIFNNDRDNSSGLGHGNGREYIETYEGKLINAKGIKARYIRFYSKGSTESALNEYTEIEVYGRPAQ